MEFPSGHLSGALPAVTQISEGFNDLSTCSSPRDAGFELELGPTVIYNARAAPIFVSAVGILASARCVSVVNRSEPVIFRKVNENRGVWLAVGLAMISLAAGGWATAALASGRSREHWLAVLVLNAIGFLGLFILVVTIVHIWRANVLKKVLVGYKHDYVVLQRRSCGISSEDIEAGQQLLDEVISLSFEIRQYLATRSVGSLLHFAIDSEHTELTLMEGTYPIGLARTEIHLRLKRLTEMTS